MRRSAEKRVKPGRERDIKKARNGLLALYLIEYNAIIYDISLDIEFFLVQV